MMHTACSRLVGSFAAILLLASCMTPARAATIDTIPIKSAADLTLPAENAPAGFTSNPSNGRAIDNAFMLTVLGRHMNYIFHKDGWTTGYHGWLDANNPAGDAFVTYDFYGFKKSAGAHAAVAPYLGLVLGVQNPVNDNSLPSNATVFIDGTGTYDPAGQPFTVVEIVFQVNNVLADVTGYYSGGDSAAADQATATTIEATAGLSDWLQAQSHPAQQSSMVWPIVPLILLLPGRRYWSRRRGT
jgi:hypothetical protein